MSTGKMKYCWICERVIWNTPGEGGPVYIKTKRNTEIHMHASCAKAISVYNGRAAKEVVNQDPGEGGE